MYRQEIVWKSVPRHIQLRGCTVIEETPAASTVEPPRPAPLPVAASFPNELGQQISTAPPPLPDVRPLLESISSTLEMLDQRRQQSLAELQQVALELAVSVASNLVFQAINKEQFAVEKLVEEAIHSMGIDSTPVISLHPQDLELLHKRLAKEPASWDPKQLTLRADPGIERGGCRVENQTGRMQISDIGLRLSEIRRHWLEELDDSQIERRSAAREGQTLRRFPDRRETA